MSPASESPVCSREDSQIYPGYDITPSKTSRTLEKLQEIEDMKMRLFREESVDSAEMTRIIGMNGIEGSNESTGKGVRQEFSSAASGRSSNDPSPNSNAVLSQHKRLRKHNEDRGQGPSGRAMQENVSGSSPLRDGPTVSCISGSSHPRGQDYEIDIEMTDDSSPVQCHNSMIGQQNNRTHTPTPVSRKLSLRPHRASPDSVTTSESKSAIDDLMDFDDLIPPAPEVKPAKQYSEFVLSLMQRRSEISQVVNPGRRRPSPELCRHWDERP